MQEDGFSHAELLPARAPPPRARPARARSSGSWPPTTSATACSPLAAGLFAACIPAIPYAPAAAFLGREKSKLVAREGEPRRVALVADGVGGMHGVTHTLDEIRERGVPGFEVEVIGTDAYVDRRLPAVAEVDIPLYPGLRVGVPSLPATVDALAEGRYDLVHLCSPGPAGVAAALIARTMELPLVGSYHTELGVYAGLRSGDERLRAGMDMALAALYGLCSTCPLAERVRRRVAACARHRARADRALGPRGGRLALQPGAARPPASTRASSTSSTRAG